MRAFLAIIHCRFTSIFQYRAAAFAGILTQVFWGIIKVMILTAFFAQTTSSQPMQLSQAINFIWLGQGLLLLLPWNIDKELEAQVRNGNVAYELVRPVDIYWIWFARSFSMRFVPTLLRAAPLFLVAILFFGLSAPVSLPAATAFALSLIGSLLLSSAITTLVLITLFWTISGEGLLRLLPHTVVLLSGLTVPLPLFPDWMQPFLSAQPFRGIVDIPCRLYTGLIPASETPYYIGFQLLWTLILLLLGKWLLKRALKQIVIQGG